MGKNKSTNHSGPDTFSKGLSTIIRLTFLAPIIIVFVMTGKCMGHADAIDVLDGDKEASHEQVVPDIHEKGLYKNENRTLNIPTGVNINNSRKGVSGGYIQKPIVPIVTKTNLTIPGVSKTNVTTPLGSTPATNKYSSPGFSSGKYQQMPKPSLSSDMNAGLADKEQKNYFNLPQNQ